MNDLVCPYCDYENDITDFIILDDCLVSEDKCDSCGKMYNFKIEKTIRVNTWTYEED
ncbi:hypothetical protein [Sporosarcina sp. FSL W7-1283]|uniref:hypothetical protein n=1 Tax=Sporosarcina sp. FSL W7-1283 TaxID=2921560 RepID=UPI0030F5F02F